MIVKSTIGICEAKIDGLRKMLQALQIYTHPSSVEKMIVTFSLFVGYSPIFPLYFPVLHIGKQSDASQRQAPGS